MNLPENYVLTIINIS